MHPNRKTKQQIGLLPSTELNLCTPTQATRRKNDTPSTHNTSEPVEVLTMPAPADRDRTRIDGFQIEIEKLVHM